MAQSIEQNGFVEPILSPREAYEVFDCEVRRLMSMSGKEFIERWETGELAAIADKPGSRHIMRLALMMPRDGQQSR